MSKIEELYEDGDNEALIVAVMDAFKSIKNKFIYPSSVANTKINPARYVHKCDRKPDCECVPLITHILHAMSNESIFTGHSNWSDEIDNKLENLICDPRIRMPFGALIMWI